MAKKLQRSASPYLASMKPFTRGDTKPVKFLTEKDMTESKKDRLKSWITFYRFNPSYFVEHYMEVNLYPYQRFWINLISRSTEFIGIASRASAKSWLIAVYAIARCILYPGTIVALASSTKAQAGLIISEKCQMLYDKHPNIARECSSITSNQNKWEMTFHNTSKINVVVSGEGGRGHRSHVTVLEERRLIPNAIIDSVIRPFLVSRQPPYLEKPQYAEIEELHEEPIEIIITSAHYKSYEWWPETKKFLKAMAAGDNDIKAVFFDYLIVMRHGIKTRKQMKKEKDTLDPVTFLMEYGNIPYGSSTNSFYKLGLFNRTVKRSWRPMTDEMAITKEKNIYDIPKKADEIRILSVDVAMRAGSTNDNTIITCARLLPSKKGWLTEITYLESHNGMSTNLQALRIKQIYTEFKADVLILDVANAGIGVYDSLSSVTKDEVRGVEYDPYTVMATPDIDDKVYEELFARTLGKDALPVIFPITGSASLNSVIAIKFRERLKKRLVSFLVDDNTEEEFLIGARDKNILEQDDSTVRSYLLQANLQTTLLINESISLEMSMAGAAGLVKLVEPAGARKDRYTSVSYLNYYVSIMDTELLKDKYVGSDESEFLGVTMF